MLTISDEGMTNLSGESWLDAGGSRADVGSVGKEATFHRGGSDWLQNVAGDPGLCARKEHKGEWASSDKKIRVNLWSEWLNYGSER